MSGEQADPREIDIEPEMVRRLLQHAPLSVSQTVIVARGPQVIAHRGALRQMEAADVAVYVAAQWRDRGQTLRLQFMRLPLATAGHMLLIYPLGGDYRLTLVDAEDAPLNALRRLGSQLLGVLRAAGLL